MKLISMIISFFTMIFSILSPMNMLPVFKNINIFDNESSYVQLTDDVKYSIKGDSVTFLLGASAGTGYQWSSKITQGDSVKLVSSDVINNAKPGIDGGPLTYKFVFKAVKDGKSTVQFKFARSWESTGYDKLITKTVNVSNGKIEIK